MRAAMNCALANRQILTHLVREVFTGCLPGARLDLLYDVSNNSCKREEHFVEGKRCWVFVHRKGATRAFGPGHPELPETLRPAGQPVLIGGFMGTGSYILAGMGAAQSPAFAFASACHGAGRSMSRHQATRTWQGRQVVEELARRGILILTLPLNLASVSRVLQPGLPLLRRIATIRVDIPTCVRRVKRSFKVAGVTGTGRIHHDLPNEFVLLGDVDRKFVAEIALVVLLGPRGIPILLTALPERRRHSPYRKMLSSGVGNTVDTAFSWDPFKCAKYWPIGQKSDTFFNRLRSIE